MADELIAQATKLLKNSELVAIPTETVYGLAGNALDIKAVSKIFQVKNRPSFDPLIVHTYSIEEVKKIVKDFPEKAQKLADKFWPGPLTLLLEKIYIIPDLVTAGLPTVAVRIPNHPLTLELLKNLDFPLAAPSANPFGYISPTSAEHVKKQLGDKIKLILDGGTCKIGLESTIIGFEKEEIVMYRLGGISFEAIEAIVGKVKILPHSVSNPSAPGMLKSHYAPKKPFLIRDFKNLDFIENELKDYSPEKIGILSFQNKLPCISQQNQVVLSKNADFAEAAQNLFAGMRYLDNLNIEIIFAELLPEIDLGRAINDRIRRAAAK